MSLLSRDGGGVCSSRTECARRVRREDLFNWSQICGVIYSGGRQGKRAELCWRLEGVGGGELAVREQCLERERADGAVVGSGSWCCAGAVLVLVLEETESEEIERVVGDEQLRRGEMMSPRKESSLVKPGEQARRASRRRRARGARMLATPTGQALTEGKGAEAASVLGRWRRRLLAGRCERARQETRASCSEGLRPKRKWRSTSSLLASRARTFLRPPSC